MHVDTSKLEAHVEGLRNAIAMSHISLEEAKQAADNMDRLIHESSCGDSFNMEEFNRIAEKADLYFKAQQIASYELTLAAQLMKVETKYLVSNEKRLISPAGFHPEDGVFIQTRIAIHTDTLQGMPSSNIPLYAHTVH